MKLLSSMILRLSTFLLQEIWIFDKINKFQMSDSCQKTISNPSSLFLLPENFNLSYNQIKSQPSHKTLEKCFQSQKILHNLRNTIKHEASINPINWKLDVVVWLKILSGKFSIKTNLFHLSSLLWGRWDDLSLATTYKTTHLYHHSTSTAPHTNIPFNFRWILTTATSLITSLERFYF